MANSIELKATAQRPLTHRLSLSDQTPTIFTGVLFKRAMECSLMGRSGKKSKRRAKRRPRFNKKRGSSAPHIVKSPDPTTNQLSVDPAIAQSPATNNGTPIHQPLQLPVFLEQRWNWPTFDPESCQECGTAIPIHDTAWLLNDDVFCEICCNAIEQQNAQRDQIIDQINQPLEEATTSGEPERVAINIAHHIISRSQRPNIPLRTIPKECHHGLTRRINSGPLAHSSDDAPFASDSSSNDSIELPETTDTVASESVPIVLHDEPLIDTVFDDPDEFIAVAEITQEEDASLIDTDVSDAEDSIERDCVAPHEVEDSLAEEELSIECETAASFPVEIDRKTEDMPDDTNVLGTEACEPENPEAPSQHDAHLDTTSIEDELPEFETQIDQQRTADDASLIAASSSELTDARGKPLNWVEEDLANDAANIIPHPAAQQSEFNPDDLLKLPLTYTDETEAGSANNQIAQSNDANSPPVRYQDEFENEDEHTDPLKIAIPDATIPSPEPEPIVTTGFKEQETHPLDAIPPLQMVNPLPPDADAKQRIELMHQAVALRDHWFNLEPNENSSFRSTG